MSNATTELPIVQNTGELVSVVLWPVGGTSRPASLGATPQPTTTTIPDISGVAAHGATRNHRSASVQSTKLVRGK